MTDTSSEPPARTPVPSVEEARAMHKAGRYDEAIRAYRRIIADDPANAEAQHLAGVLLVQRGSTKDGLGLISRAVGGAGRQPRYHNSLGSAQMTAGRPAEAAESFGNALVLDPDFLDARFNLGVALHAQGKTREAEKVWRVVLDRNPEHAGALINLGGLLQRSRRVEEAGELFERAAAAHPDSAEALWSLANLRETQNRLEDAEAALDRLLAAAPGHRYGQLLKARLLRRRERFEEAHPMLQEILRQPVHDVVAIDALFEVGHVLDRMGKYWLAYEAFETGNTRRAQTPSYRAADPRRYRTRVTDSHGYFTAERLAELAAIGREAAGETDPAQAPVFFVGFPRSGTTLMEQMLAGHPRLATTAERTPLTAALARLAAEVGEKVSYPDSLRAFTPAVARSCRETFAEAAGRITGGERRLLDKLPLNIVDLGFVNAILPEARVVTALRDPRDVVLSCFMQRFRPNDAMASFTDMDNTVELYDAVMSLWRHYREALTLPWMEYRYEDLVADVEGTARKVVGFIGEEWDPAVLDYRGRARDTAVATPSYRDVADDVYARAVGRWRKYVGPLNAVMPLLKPHVKAFGYDAE
ncbi:MAG: sulfotransferase [Acetobacterales bacterium]